MIIWGRWSILVPVFAVAAMFLTEEAANLISRNAQFTQNNPWVKSLGLCIGGVIMWPIGRWFNRPEPERVLVDSQTGESVVMQAGGGNTLFFIPMEYWSIIFIVFGIITFIKPPA